MPLQDQSTAILRPGYDPGQTSPETGLALVAYAGAVMGNVFLLEPGKYVLGRSTDASIILLDTEISRQHLRLEVTAEPAGTLRVQAEDLHSTNGTRLNGRPLTLRTELQPDDRLALGSHVFKLVCLDALELAFHRTILDRSTRDPLTGLLNRAVIMRELQNHFQLAQRYQRKLSVLLCDLDNFKNINDSFGHQAGDQVLRSFGELVRTKVRQPDLAGRFGGEEFLIILPETDIAGAKILAERLRQAAENHKVALGDKSITCTCSLGGAERDSHDQDGGVLLGRADEALYRAKASGRNRVEG